MRTKATFGLNVVLSSCSSITIHLQTDQFSWHPPKSFYYIYIYFCNLTTKFHFAGKQVDKFQARRCEAPCSDLINASHIQRYPGPPCVELRASGTHCTVHSWLAGFRGKILTVGCVLETAQLLHQILDVCRSADCIREED